MDIAIIGGTGRQGRGLALRLARAGLEVWIGSREADRARQVAAALRDRLQALGVEAAPIHGAANAEAVQKAEIAFLTVPHPHYVRTAQRLKPHLEGKVVVDVSIPLARYKPPHLIPPPEGSAAEAVQAALGSAKVVAAFKNTPAGALASLERPLEADELVCGDDPQAKGAVIALIERMGGRAWDAGPLKGARALELLTGLLIELAQRHRRRDVGLKLIGI